MKKEIFLFALFLWALLIGTGYLVGNYFVNYALMRGSDGSPPPACAKIADPNLKAPHLPKALGVREDWNILSSDGLNLRAVCLHPKLEHPHRWAVLVHGYGRNKDFTWDYAEEYLKEGYVTLSPDLRGAGDSEGTYLTMGDKESDDLKLWIEEILRHDPDAKIVLHGVSMGAATVMTASAKDLPSNVTAIIEDCGYTSAYDMFTEQLDKLFHLPETPIMPCVDIVCRQKTGVSLSYPTPLDCVAESSIPILFIHGDADKLVPFEMMQTLYEASAASVKERFIVHGAGHASAKNANPKAYFRKVFAFLEPRM